MKIIFSFADGSQKSSPEFMKPSEDIVEFFWNEFLGGSEEQDAELFWNCEVSDDDDDIIIDWFVDPADHQKVVTNMEKGLIMFLPPYSSWV